ncbi:SusC/RagA family TonB-linked outer membrane protein [Dinghuibacter silviterrae]|nr:SusC/RagA family TonB-linked outer membrane protein [Dinghuibacter silviterrae]
MRSDCQHAPRRVGKTILSGLRGIAIPALLTLPFSQTTLAARPITHNIVRLPRPVKGRVLDADGKPLSGASILVKGTRLGVKTDQDGAFELNVPDDAKTLVVSYIGKETVEMDVRGKSTISVVLKDAVMQAQDVVVVGYGTQKKELLTGSVATVKFKDADVEVPTTMTGNLLAGRVAGVDVGNISGLPGQQNPNIIIRTNSSWNAQPVLYVIDGKISTGIDFNNLSPLEIDNIAVLKDAATAAVYGSRAAGGVIVVTTKKGKSGKPVITYSYNTGIDTRTKGVSLTSAVQAGQLFNEFDGTTSFWSWQQADYDYFNSHNFGGGKGWGYDMLKDVWRDPSTMTHNLGVSGGSDNVKYFIGGSYVRQNGFLSTTTYDKYNLRANVTADMTKNFQVFAGMALNSNITNNATGIAGGSTYDLYRKLLVWQPDEPVWTTGANPGMPISYGWIANMGAEVSGMGGGNNSNYLKPVITLSGTYKVPFVPGLSATASFIKSYTQNRLHSFIKPYQMATVATGAPYANHIWYTDSTTGYVTSQNVPSIQDVVNWSEDRQLNFQLNYEKTIADVHHFKAWLIYEQYGTSGSGVNALINGFPVTVTDQWWAASTKSGTQFVSNSPNYSTYENGRKSWAGQFFYDYASKYLATFAYRYDGSANFAPNRRWGFFPSGSLGWIMSKERFFEHVKGVDQLKLRATVGLVGNDNLPGLTVNGVKVGSWQWQQSYQAGNSAYFGATPSTNAGITYGGVINPDLTWEKTLNTNIGIDVSFLKHYTATIDAYHNNTYDILGARIQTIPPTFPRALPAVNYGAEKNQGLELMVGYNGQIGRVRFNTSVNASYGYAWYTKMDQNLTYPWQNLVGSAGGRHASYIPGYQVAGILRTQADLNNLAAAKPNYNFYGTTPALGQLVYKDLSGPSGKPDGVIDDNDITVLRKDNNPVVVGWHFESEWKGFSLAFTFAGYFHQMTDISPVAGGVEWNRMWSKWATDSWSPSTPNASLPYKYSANDPNNQVTYPYEEWITANPNYTSNGAVSSSFWLKHSNFIRLRNLTLAYTIPKYLYQRYGIDNVHLFVSGANLFIISRFNRKYWDPESAKVAIAATGSAYGDGTDFPIMRSFNGGISVSF